MNTLTLKEIRTFKQRNIIMSTNVEL